MTDIVERLRHRYPQKELGPELRAGDPSVAWEAADEIERLRAALQSIADYPHNDIGPKVHLRVTDFVRTMAKLALEPKP